MVELDRDDLSVGVLTGLGPQDLIKELSRWCYFEANKYIDYTSLYISSATELAAIRVKDFTKDLNRELMSSGALTPTADEVFETHQRSFDYGHVCQDDNCVSQLIREVSKAINGEQ